MTIVNRMIAIAKSTNGRFVERDQGVEEGKEEDVPRRVEGLDPQEPLRDDRCQVLATRFSLIGPGRSRRDGMGCIGRCASPPIHDPLNSP